MNNRNAQMLLLAFMVLGVHYTSEATGQDAHEKRIRVGVIGLGTSHVTTFTKGINAPNETDVVAACHVMVACPKGSLDIEEAVSRIPKHTKELEELGVEIVPTIETLLTKVDAVLLETYDGRPHLEQLLPVLKAKKRVFIDKPLAGSLSDAILIFEAAEKYGVPIFSSSSLRFGKNTLAVRGGSIGKVTYCETSSPAIIEKTHPDLFWYGIHGVESLFTVMGTGCQSVVRSITEDGRIVVTGKWADGRVGVFEENEGYTGMALGENGETAVGSYDGSQPLVDAICTYFQTGEIPVAPEETLEIYAFMEAADESKRQGGAEVSLESVMAKAREDAASRRKQLFE